MDDNKFAGVLFESLTEIVYRYNNRHVKKYLIAEIY